MTITDCLERSLKKGNGEEKAAAAMSGILLLIQLGASEWAEEVFKSLYPILKVVLADASASFTARAAVKANEYLLFEKVSLILREQK